jgi:phosphoglycolate phosphatase
MIKLIFFDWNGTILSDAAANLEAGNDALALFGIKPITSKRSREIFDIPITKFYSEAGVNEKRYFENRLKIQEAYHNSYERLAEHCRARIGAGVLLRWLHSEGIRSVILSNHTIKSIERNLKRLKLEQYVDAILANDDILSTGLKDKAIGAESYVKENGFARTQILVVGDSPQEAEIAKRLGGRSVLVSGGWYSEKRLKDANPDYVVRRLDKLIGVIKELNGR